ncbi:hypothetical protein [Sinomonas atrocyanea]|uniref:hypothetical protein n=1 Tax=Sinomonas atrocyanea TaxID=37927 RepID=UPI003D9666C5
MIGLIGDLDRNKRMTVGSGCPPFPRQSVATANVSFTVVVTAIWTWYREKLRHDLHFLTPRADAQQKKALRDFERLLDDQRHYNEHADFKRTSEAQAWRAAARTSCGASPDEKMVRALLEELSIALGALRSIAGKVSRDAAGTEAWRRHEARTPETEIRAVLADLGRDNLPQSRVDTVVRRFNGHPKLKYARTPQDRMPIAAVVAMEMNLDPLTISYDEILDEFGLIGDPLGFSLLLVAHGIEAAGFTGRRLVPILRGAWREIDSQFK